MSDLFDIRPGGSKQVVKTDKKAAKAARKETETKEQKRAQRKTKIISISVISVLLLAFIGAMTINSNLIRREVAVITIDGVEFSAAEFDFFYVVSLNEYRQMIEQQMPGMAEFILPQRHIPYSEQINPSTGESWEDFFIELAIDSMSSVVQRYNRARAAGFVMPDDIREQMEDGIEWTRMLAEFDATVGSLNEWLSLRYGPAINEATYLRLNEMRTIAFAYEQSIIPEFTFTQEELDEYYNENRNELDVFTMRLITIWSDVDFEIECYEEAVAAGMKTAKARAEQIVAAVESVEYDYDEGFATREEIFIAEAMEYNPFELGERDSTLQIHQGAQFPDVVAQWLTSAERQYGDVASLVDEGNAVHVVYFINRDDNSYLLTNFRQLLFLRQDLMAAISPADFEDESEYLAEFNRLDDAAYALAREFYDKFVELGANESALDQLVSEYEDMDLDGELYSDIAKLQIQAPSPDRTSTMKVVPEIEEWLFDPSRQVGDFELIRTEAFGFHLVYFTGFGDRFSNVIADNRLSRMAHEAWIEALEPVDVTKSGLFSILTSTRLLV